MLGVKLICVGKLKESYWRQAVAEYEKRLKPLCRWELIELPEARLSNTPTPGEISAALEKEGSRFSGTCPVRFILFVLRENSFPRRSWPNGWQRPCSLPDL